MYNPPPPYPQNPNEGPDSKTEKVNTIWKSFVAIYILATFALIFYWEFTDSGLCIMVRDWQEMILEDSYYPALDILLSMLMALAPLFVLKFIVEKIAGVKIDGFKK